MNLFTKIILIIGMLVSIIAINLVINSPDIKIKYQPCLGDNNYTKECLCDCYSSDGTTCIEYDCNCKFKRIDYNE